MPAEVFNRGGISPGGPRSADPGQKVETHPSERWSPPGCWSNAAGDRWWRRPHHSFLTKPRTLLSLGGRTRLNREVLEALDSGDFELPPGCSVDFELETVAILSRLALPSKSEAKRLEEFCRNYESENGIRPTATQAFSSVGVRTSSRPVNAAAGWHQYLDELGLLMSEERAVVKALGPVLRGLERESLTKAYKLVTLAALLKLDALHTGASIAKVAEVSLGLTRRDPRLRADTEQTREVSDLDSVTSERWRAFWTKNPLTHLTDKPHSLFQLSGQRLEPRFQVPAEHVTAFSALVSEIVEWRLQIYLRERLGGEELGTQTDAPEGRQVSV